jgi:PEP-CTERM motif
MLRLSHWAAIAVVLGLAGGASAQVVTFDFEDGTDQGFGHKFSTGDASETFPIVFIGGSNRMRVVRDGDFQEAERIGTTPADPFYQAMLAASANEAGYRISYDYYIDTAAFGTGAGTFLQVGTYVNTGSGYYAQDFPTTGKDVELNAAQLASGSVFSGTVDETFAAKGYDLPAGETFFRFGFIINGDGANQAVHFDNIRITPVPEPTSLALLALGLPALLARRRRRGS